MSRVQLALNVADIDAAVDFYSKLFAASATARLSGEGLEPDVQESTTCCYALQDKAWVTDPDGAPWEVYTVLADAPAETGLGCSTEACTPEPVTVTTSGTGRSCC